MALPRRNPIGQKNSDCDAEIISSKMSVGMDIVRDAEETATLPYNNLNKIQQ